MSTRRWKPGWVLAGMVATIVAAGANADWIPTNEGNGADAEVRESFSASNRGSSTELASRVLNQASPPDDQSDRNSLMYMRFDLSTTAIPALFDTAFRLTYRNNNLQEDRIQDAITPDSSVRTGLSIYGLDPAASGSNWSESTITYDNAPGLTPDGDVGTRDLNSDLIFLGDVIFPEIGTQNHLPVGEAIVFQSATLNQFVSDALTGGATAVTLVAHVMHDGSAPFNSWLNFNYLFNSKEQTTLNADASYDSDITDGGNPLGSPWSEADNSTGEFSPSLLIQEMRPAPESAQSIPVLGTFGLLLLAGLIAAAGCLALSRAGRAVSSGRYLAGDYALPAIECSI